MKTGSSLVTVVVYILAGIGALALIGLGGMAIIRSIMMGGM